MIRRRDLLARLSFLGFLGGGRPTAGAQASPGPASAEIQVHSIDGPLVVTSSLRRQRDLFEGGFGLSLVSDQELDTAAVRALFGVTERSARTLLLQSKGASTGVRLVEFRPSARHAARDGAGPADVDTLGTIDLAVRDAESTRSLLAARGFPVASPAAGQPVSAVGALPQERVMGPDAVVCLFQKIDAPGPPSGEVLGVSAAASDHAAAVAFYRDMLGLTAGPGNEAGNGPVTDFGVAGRTPLIRLLRSPSGPRPVRSLRARAVLPNRGLQALRLSVSSVQAVARSAAAARLEVVTGPSEALLFPQGRVRSILVRAPHGVLHQFTETLKG